VPSLWGVNIWGLREVPKGKIQIQSVFFSEQQSGVGTTLGLADVYLGSKASQEMKLCLGWVGLGEA
jgi:hypothetical protein